MNPALPSTSTNRLGSDRAEVSPSSAAPLRWDSEVFVLRGDDRDDLRRRVQALADFLARTSVVELKDLAFTLNMDLAPGGSRLAIVAGTAIELQTRLGRAAVRLGDPKCRSIKDTQGVYYFDQPLYPEGKLAVLFPGEGAQYVNMLADLFPHFPTVREHFERCDRLRIAKGNEPVWQHIFLAATATEAERAAAEQNLWRLGNAVSSVLISEWALYVILRELGLEADVIGGHSAGEFSALLAAGCMDPDDFFIEELASLSQLLQGLEDDGQFAEMALVAVGAARRTALELLGPDAGVFIAMDNCPHQTVLACTPADMPTVERILGAGNILCERLPFRRPYHTPLFEPFLPPFVEMYERLPVRPPRVPLYSCTTGQLYPESPADIRRLAVAHWAAPVEFIRMVETMYADGVRVFVEAGPRGNLTSFLEDVFRGRPVAAIASNVTRRSGLTQLNHLAGQLLAHHVPLRLDHFYRRREPRLVAWEASGVASAPRETQASGVASAPRDSQAIGALTQPHSPRAAVMEQYFGVMEQFLDVEREVMEQFLARRSGAPAVRRPVWPLLGEIVRHEPGRELVMQRRMSIREDLYACDHTLGGRDASAVDPTQHGLPFMPMAFSLEMMAEAAASLLPGRLVIGMKRVRLQRWIPFDDEPITLELTARIRPETPDEVAVEIRDLGNAVRPGNADTAAVVGTVLLGKHYPEPPPCDDFPLTHEGPAHFTPHQLYGGERRLFHGPLFEALDSTDRQGDEGIEGHLRTLPHSGLFHSTAEPDLILDPLLIDASTHLLGSWHLSQSDQAGRVVLPYELGSVTLYGPRPAVGARVKCRVRVENGSARQVSHRIDLIGPNGRLWCRLAPAEYWRFYWPREYVDFFRFKERFLLAKDWPACTDPATRCVRLDPPSDLCQPVHRTALARIALSRSEWKIFRLLKIDDSQLTDWLFGRIAAKDAIRSLWMDRHGQRLLPADIELGSDAGVCSTARYRGGNLVEPLPCVAFASMANVSFAVAVFGRDVRLTLRHRDGEVMAEILRGERKQP